MREPSGVIVVKKNKFKFADLPKVETRRKIDIPVLLAGALIIIVAAWWLYVLTQKYRTFAYYDWDTAFFHQAMWNLLRGRVFNSLFNTNFLGNHLNLIAFLFLPFYAFFQSAIFLIYLKVLCYVFAAGRVLPARTIWRSQR